MINSENGMITRCISYLATFPAIVLESTFCLLTMVRYLLVTSLKGYLSRGSSTNFNYKFQKSFNISNTIGSCLDLRQWSNFCLHTSSHNALIAFQTDTVDSKSAAL